jgi:L-fucose isomerase
MQMRPKIGLINVADPRLGLKLKSIQADGERYAATLAKAGIDAICAWQTATDDASARKALSAVNKNSPCGIILRCAWFLRSNVIATLAQETSVPIMLWAVPNPDDTAFEAMALAHGSLDELGSAHTVHYGDLAVESLAKIIAWSRACLVKKSFMGSVYGEIGGRSLEMLPASSDYNQLRRIFGIHVDPIEQWTLIRMAEKIPAGEWRKICAKWKKTFGHMNCNPRSLERSAKFYLAGKRLFQDRKWDFAGIQCQLELIDNYLAPCLPVAMWNEDGFTVSCETDVNNAIGMYLCQLASGRPAMFADLFYLDRKTRVVHALNCGTGAPSLAGGADKSAIEEQTPLQGTWDKEKKCSRCKGGACVRFILPPGPVTLIRFGRIKGEYVVHVTEAQAIDHNFNPKELGGIAGIWPFAYIRLDEQTDLDCFINNLRSHHTIIAPGRLAGIVKFFSRLCNLRLLD